MALSNIVENYKNSFKGERLRSLFIAITLLVISLIIQFYASNYSTRSAGHFVGDFFLDNLPVINLNPVIIEGALWSLFFTSIFILSRPRSLIFTIKAISIFIIIRSFFVSVTHLGIYPDQIVPGQGLMDDIYVLFNLQAGYFFSGHTGTPFLMALLYWNKKFWRDIFLALSIIFGVSVLLAHIHYSIDVFAAPFMTYGIYKISIFLFEKDFKTSGLDG